jgi:hypothetical protein
MKRSWTVVTLQGALAFSLTPIFFLAQTGSRAAFAAVTEEISISTNSRANTYTVGSQIFLTVTITNGQAASIQIPNDVKDLTITVTTATGQAVRPQFLPSRGHFGPIQPNNAPRYSVLQSGASHAYTTPLSTIDGGFILDQAGAYEIAVSTTVGLGSSGPETAGHRAFLRSNVLKIAMQ